MVKKYSFDENLIYAGKRESFVVKYLCENLGYSFVAGEVDGVTVNFRQIEKIFNCEYVPHQKYKGAQLKFKDENSNQFILATMPDELLSKNNKYRWVEIKSKRDTSSYFIDENKINSYKTIARQTKIPLFIVTTEDVYIGFDTYLNIRYISLQDILNPDFEKVEKRDGFYILNLSFLPLFNSEPLFFESSDYDEFSEGDW